MLVNAPARFFRAGVDAGLSLTELSTCQQGCRYLNEIYTGKSGWRRSRDIAYYDAAERDQCRSPFRCAVQHRVDNAFDRAKIFIFFACGQNDIAYR